MRTEIVQILRNCLYYALGIPLIKVVCYTIADYVRRRLEKRIK